MSEIAIIGATGNVGRHLMNEALRRRHRVTAIARNAATVAAQAGVTVRSADLHDAAAFSAALSGHDAVFCSVRFAGYDRRRRRRAGQARRGVGRLMVVGGAGSLFAAPGMRVIDSPGFPEAYRTEAAAGAAFLDALRDERGLDWTLRVAVGGIRRRQAHPELSGWGWTNCSSTARAEVGSRFRTSRVAFLDEFEKPAHIRQRFTVGY